MQANNTTVKKYDGVTDVTFVIKTPSAGDKSPAVWSLDSAHAVRAFRPSISEVAGWNGPRTARRTTIVGKFPIVRNVNGSDAVISTIPLELSVPVPSNVTDAEAQEVVAQFLNFCVARRDDIISGYAAS